MLKNWLSAATALIASHSVAAADFDAAAAFGARPAAHGMALSPDAGKVLYLTPSGSNGSAVVVADLASGKTTVVLTSKGNQIRPVSCNWKTETRLICLLYGVSDQAATKLSFTRVLAVDADGGNLKQLGQRSTADAIVVNQNSGRVLDWLPDDPGHVLMAVDVAEHETTGSVIKSSAYGLSVQRVDTRTGGAVIVEQPKTSVYGFGTDDHGNVRLKIAGSDADGYIRNTFNYFVRAKGSKNWQPAGQRDATRNIDLDYAGFDASGDWLYALKPLDGRQALYRVATDGSKREELVFAHPQVDVEDVQRIGKYRRPVAVDYTVEAPTRHYLDPALAKLTASLTRALPGHPRVDVLDESWDGTKLLVAAEGDNEPGVYYLYDTSAHKLAELLPLRADLKGVAMGPVAAVTYPAADGTPIPAYLTLPPGGAAKHLRAIVMPHGGPSARDTGGFDWLAQYYASLGYAVLQPNYRGSAGYGDAWYKTNGFKSWRTAMSDINDGARWLVAQGTADAGKLAIVGWSYGGYAALQANVLEPKLYRAAVAIAPVTDLEGLRSKALNAANFKQVDAMIGTGPHVGEGSPARNAGRIEVPVLMFSGDHDLNVDVSQARSMDAALTRMGKRHELIVYPGLDHQLDDHVARTDLLRRSAAFLDANLH